MSVEVVISGSGLHTPAYKISNEELVDCFNQYVDKFNAENATNIESGEVEAKQYSSAEFIEKASGIKSRYAYIKEGILDVDRMRPIIPKRSNDELSDHAAFAVASAKKAIENANKRPEDVDAVIVSCANTQRAYPAIAIEVQQELGIKGFGFDMLVACSAATFALHRAYEMIKAENAKCVLVINPELACPQINYKERDSHFIFGDVSVSTIVERIDTCTTDHALQVVSTKAITQFSNNIRANFGYLLNANDSDPLGIDQYFTQNGRAVFKEVSPLVVEHLSGHVGSLGLKPTEVKRWWLHQANINMNQLICKYLLGRDAEFEEAPTVLDEFANTGSAGSMVAFHKYRDSLQKGDYGVICSFGAGYSIGSLVLRKC